MPEPQPRPVRSAVEDLNGFEFVLVLLDELLEVRDERLGFLQGMGVVACLEQLILRDLVDDLLVAPFQVQ